MVTIENPFNPHFDELLLRKSPLNVESIKNSYVHIFREAGYQIDTATLLYMTKQTMLVPSNFLAIEFGK